MGPHDAVPLLDEFSYTGGGFVEFDAVDVGEHWVKGVPDWPRENDGRVRDRFLGVPLIYSSSAGATLSIPFEGTAIGAYLLSGPDAGIVRCVVDDRWTKEIDLLHRHSGFNYPMTQMFFNELPAGKHRLALEILENRPGRMRPGGTALRVLHFVVNPPLEG